MLRGYARQHINEAKRKEGGCQTLHLKSDLCVLQSPCTFKNLKRLMELMSEILEIARKSEDCDLKKRNQIEDQVLISFKTIELVLILNLQALEKDKRTTLTQLT